MALSPGTRLGSYEITSLLGSGGMGQVYKARDLKLDRDVAVKVLREELASDPERLRRFEQEARAASGLNHPNIIHIYDIGKHGSTPYIAMEYVEGKTLREILSEGPLSIKRLLDIGAQIGDGLAKAHAAGIVHRDLKPENIMVTADGFVKILDFGLAKLMPQPAEVDSEMTTLTKGTQPGVVMGTVGYMSPEQASGKAADYRSDQFALGLILYEMATGKMAFRRDTVPETLTAIIREEPDPIAVLNPEVPSHLIGIVERCLVKEPQERYDSTRDLSRDLKGIGQVPPVAVSTAPARRLWPGIVSGAGILVVGLAIAVALNPGGAREWLLGGTTPGTIESLAVLPLENLSGDPEQEYFADGMTDELIAQLARIGALKVISRTSVMQYKGARKPLPEIARELNVDAVVEGTVRRSEDRVRITAQLIDAATDRHLWAESYERTLREVLTLQSEVARAIAQEIRVTLTPAEGTQPAATRLVDAEVYDAYLRGRFHWYAGGAAEYKRAIEYLEEVTEREPDFAPGYAGLADAYTSLARSGDRPWGELYSKAREAALRAIEIDETLSEAHNSLGYVRLMLEFDWLGAEREIKRALELDPSSVNARNNYRSFLAAMGRHDEAIAAAEEARRLDPLMPRRAVQVAETHYLARDYEMAVKNLREAIAMQPNLWVAHFYLAHVLTAKNSLDEATRAAQEAVSHSSRSPWALAQLGLISGLSGNTILAEEMIAELKERRGRDFAPAQAIARVYTGLGEKDQAFEWLEKAYEERVQLWNIRVLPLWDPLRADPRFQDFLRRMNFPE